MSSHAQVFNPELAYQPVACIHGSVSGACNLITPAARAELHSRVTAATDAIRVVSGHVAIGAAPTHATANGACGLAGSLVM